MVIELRGDPDHFRKLIQELSRNRDIFRDPGHPLAYMVSEIEDQLEPNADRSFDWVDLEEMFAE